MEEDMKILEELLKASKENDMYEGNKYFKSLEYFIKEYQDLKEIEESHRKENGKLRERVKELEEENQQLEAIKDEAIRRYNLESIPTSLVEEKIEENNKIMQETEKKYKGTYAGLDEYRNALAQNKVLQELLEKRKER